MKNQILFLTFLRSGDGIQFCNATLQEIGQVVYRAAFDSNTQIFSEIQRNSLRFLKR
jgi:hypothetical protein